jgi:hypothetical protein
VLRSRYINEEQKFIRVFQLLWAYDNVWVETSLRYENTERIKDVHRKFRELEIASNHYHN